MRATETRQQVNQYAGYRNVWEVEFDTFDDFMETVSKAPAGGVSHKRDHGFMHSDSWEAAVKLTKDGWPEGEAKARAYSARLFNLLAAQVQQPRYIYDVEGMSFDTARVIAGEPEPWIQEYHEVVPAPGRVLRVVYNFNASGAVSTDVIITRGAVAVALVQLLEHAGHSVELIAREDSASGGWQSKVNIVIKRAGQPLNLSEVAFALAHPSMLRRFDFALYEVAPSHIASQYIHSGYGRPEETPEGPERGDIYIGRMMYPETQWSKPEHAEAWIIEQLKNQGVEVSK
jgi:hypothetical protein